MAVVLSKKMKKGQLWLAALYNLYAGLSKTLGNNFVKLAAPRNPSITLHDRNLVIVVRRLSDDVIDIIYDVIEDVEKEFGIENEILPIVLKENDTKIEEYENVFRT